MIFLTALLLSSFLVVGCGKNVDTTINNVVNNNYEGKGKTNISTHESEEKREGSPIENKVDQSRETIIPVPVGPTLEVITPKSRSYQ